MLLRLKRRFMVKTNKLCSNCKWREDHYCMCPIKKYDCMIGTFTGVIYEQCQCIFGTKHCKYVAKED